MQGGIRDPWAITQPSTPASLRPANDNGILAPREDVDSVVLFGPGGCSDRYMRVYPLFCPANDSSPLMVS